MSLPAGPTMRSLPVPTMRKSLHAPPVTTSSPEPPKIMSSALNRHSKIKTTPAVAAGIASE